MFAIQSRPRWANKLFSPLLATGLILATSAIAGTDAYGGPARASASKNSHAQNACQSQQRKHCETARSSIHSIGDRPAISGSRHSRPHPTWATSATRAPARAPTLTVSGELLSWTSTDASNKYILVRKLGGQTDQYSTVTGTTTTPTAMPGDTVRYSVRSDVARSRWATEQSISYPATLAATLHQETVVPVSPPSVTPPGISGEDTTTTTPTPTPSPTPSPTFPHKIIGTNDGAGWGGAAAETIIAGHITWNRVEIGGPYNPISASQQEGFHALAIVGNIEDDTPLSQIEPNSWAATVVSQIQANPDISIAEAGNEMYLKGGIANPVQYGRMYLAAVNAMRVAGIHTPLLFDMLGDFPTPSWSAPTDSSLDADGGGWLRDAVNGVPGLASAILANGLGTHPYGALHEDASDSYGVGAVVAQESVAQTVLGAIPPVYITEFGYDLSRCGQVDGACSQQEQASELKAAYEVFLADPHVAGIWCYQSHDDGTGQWGYMNNDNTTRPAFNVLSSFAIAEGQ